MDTDQTPDYGTAYPATAMGTGVDSARCEREGAHQITTRHPLTECPLLGTAPTTDPEPQPGDCEACGPDPDPTRPCPSGWLGSHSIIQDDEDESDVDEDNYRDLCELRAAVAAIRDAWDRGDLATAVRGAVALLPE